ncbi:tRNA (N6-isopentenyl adenosine(37)-C2)-methylthiotransferase MiaB [Helicobacter turcicus]|uniref:tRNA-2-methylthio-N(6)-dimethylallyladenosine synthase n=1 Tax=Helicobacter turcicus TaxID=2867412 RepID=A0ABS7JMZ6_9HELI|nr:tRNA (N6-isopentenyl adenosine(37)-C2)-methylthiotransferase MiaB [Helicobacter turcicus]MBX7490768.1 tRNA (N6-isopentenyl adenosine(37)-C2)-methylthiotransferase MiaB [Helicobacter turcicus]MBX7545623.1 tRNA (N6-isopentenyl adenosine(37)-C2)-methylthiotransferase MiaB [Helicobacter turcicus]
MSKKLYIETLGCAMNERDSAHMIAELEEKEFYSLTDNPKEADLILINTCSVREKPEKKLFSEIGQYVKIKKQGAKIGVCGCTASHLGDKILKRSKAVDFVLGARNVSKISQIIHQKRVAWVDIDYDDSTYVFSQNQHSALKGMINISIGCDKKCTYCIVPHTRGNEISIPADLILQEARRLVDSGTKEILLLGQNVNNYGKRFSSAHRAIDFTQLLNEMSQINGLERIRFTSPHPLHMDDNFILEFAQNPKICKAIHMPLQSGSNEILRKMRRGYSKEWFLNRVEKMRGLVPELSIGTDIIVGFPTESEEDFLDTLDMLEKVRFDTMYSFIYSSRPHTEAHHWLEEEQVHLVDEYIAKERLNRLKDRHKEILTEDNAKQIGKIHQVLVENYDVQNLWLEGRSNTNKLVRIRTDKNLIGAMCDVKITEVKGAQLMGELV